MTEDKMPIDCRMCLKYWLEQNRCLSPVKCVNGNMFDGHSIPIRLYTVEVKDETIRA